MTNPARPYTDTGPSQEGHSSPSYRVLLSGPRDPYTRSSQPYPVYNSTQGVPYGPGQNYPSAINQGDPVDSAPQSFPLPPGRGSSRREQTYPNAVGQGYATNSTPQSFLYPSGHQSSRNGPIYSNGREQGHSDGSAPQSLCPMSGQSFTQQSQPLQGQPPSVREAQPANSFPQRFTTNTTRTTQNNQDRNQHVYIAVMGITGTGKSTFVSICSNQNVPIVRSLQSQTRAVTEYIFTMPNSITVHLLDTPGFDDSAGDDFKVLTNVASYLSNLYRNRIKLKGVIYLHNINDNRFRGSSALSLKMFEQLCGSDFYKRVFIVTNMWDLVWGLIDKDTGIQIGSQNESLLRREENFGRMIQRGTKMKRFSQNWGRPAALEILQELISQGNSASLKIQRELGSGFGLTETGAGRVLKSELLDQERKHKEELRQTVIDSQNSLARRDAQHTYALQLQKEKSEGDLAKVQRTIHRLEQDSQQLRDQNDDLVAYQIWQDNDKQGLINRIAETHDMLRNAQNLSRQDQKKIRILQDKLERGGRGADIFSDFCKLSAAVAPVFLALL